MAVSCILKIEQSKNNTPTQDGSEWLHKRKRSIWNVEAQCWSRIVQVNRSLETAPDHCRTRPSKTEAWNKMTRNGREQSNAWAKTNPSYDVIDDCHDCQDDQDQTNHHLELQQYTKKENDKGRSRNKEQLDSNYELSGNLFTPEDVKEAESSLDNAWSSDHFFLSCLIIWVEELPEESLWFPVWLPDPWEECETLSEWECCDEWPEWTEALSPSLSSSSSSPSSLVLALRLVWMREERIECSECSEQRETEMEGRPWERDPRE